MGRRWIYPNGAVGEEPVWSSVLGKPPPPFQRWTPPMCVKEAGRQDSAVWAHLNATVPLTDTHTRTHTDRQGSGQVHRGAGRTSRSTFPECVFPPCCSNCFQAWSSTRRFTFLLFNLFFILNINAIHWWKWSGHRRKHERARKEADPGRGGYSLRLCWWVKPPTSWQHGWVMISFRPCDSSLWCVFDRAQLC